jgi:Spy/CpxP family protein refolding chaperone
MKRSSSQYSSLSAMKLPAALVLAALLGVAAQPVRAAEVNDNIQNYLDLLRSDLNSVKVELVNSIMKLSQDDAKKFWSIYLQYENELGQLALSKAEMVREFVQSHENGSLDSTKAKDLAKRWLRGQRAKLDLLEKYHAKIEDVLTPVQAGQFLQIENQIGLFIDVTIAAEMPTVGNATKRPPG